MKKYCEILFLFIFIIVFNLLFIPNNLDEIWNYGFSYAIRLGEVPYKDFNMVITPLFSFVMTIPLLISNHYLSYIIFYSIFMTIEYFILDQMMGKKSYLILLISTIFFPLLYPTYNSFFLFLMIMLINLEKSNYKEKDYIIGFLIACCILTKQSAGLFFIIPTILFYKKKKLSLKKRAIGFLPPMIVFFLYLIITKSISPFINLCLLGLLDFTGNSHGFNVSIIVFLIILGTSIYIVKKDKDNMIYYYLVLSYLLYIPLFDFLHLYYVIFSFCILLFLSTKEYKIHYELLFVICMISILIMMGKERDVLHYKVNDLSHFEYKNISKDNVEYTKEIVNYMKNHETIIYHDDSYFYRIVADQKIGMLDLLNHGNHGYHGSKEIIRLIKENKEKQFLVHQDCETRIKNAKTQLDSEGYEYIVNNAKKIGEICDYDIYSFQ